eukprot:98132-Pelagomonas_calceolata.AAC.3
MQQGTKFPCMKHAYKFPACTVDTQRAKGKPLLRLSAGTSVHMFEFATEADRDVVVDRYTKSDLVLPEGTDALVHQSNWDKKVRLPPELRKDYSLVLQSARGLPGLVKD